MKSPGHVVSVVTDSRLVEQRRGQILRAAVKLFSEKGYYVVTVQQIARKAGISMGLIYQYFGDKDDILFLAQRLCRAIREHGRITQPIDDCAVRPVDEFLLVYQFTHFCHAWALKHWAFRDRFTLEEYLVGGMALLIEPFLTEKGRENFDKLGLGTAEFAGRQLEVKPPAVAKGRAR